MANHASYLDGVILNAFLPPRFGFVIKGELGRIPVAGYLLRRIGSVFVERFDVSGSARDARRLLKVADAGESLAFFPEGTFLHKPGLDRFRAGAFAAAINSNLPVVPIVIFGSRHILPSQTLRPRHGHLRLEVLNPIEPTNPAFENRKDLAELARQRILTVLDEPGLVSRDGRLKCCRRLAQRHKKRESSQPLAHDDQLLKKESICCRRGTPHATGCVSGSVEPGHRN